MNPAHRQENYAVRFDWGLAGAQAISQGCEVAVVVDILSFTTTLSVALDAGITVYPYRVGGEHAEAFADEVDAILAVGRSVACGDQISLSSPTIRNQTVVPQRLVLPSPNGATISYELAATAVTVIGASLRNARAVATWISDTYPPGTTIAIIAAGERWPDGSLRPAVEDMWGAGAVLHELAAHGRGEGFSPESRVARAAWTQVEPALAADLRDCASGRELVDAGYAQDVEIAAEINSSTHVPVLRAHRFVPAN
ncbi:2-phosphosulfolactate phosphatase [Williamsia limnetica]|uniref:Probable 2-phosphosulfolactate phosphatase n=1 Tax=Williamsia limnetica TaxID=882452 RepID=A0A318RNI4_WILLI|nr:2-phosphosulfolactate phosphatase [Williamsia limnetica]PYE20174.1 2-phosphosulfolactate phosphatase [Williamsia limnetica]